MLLAVLVLWVYNFNNQPALIAYKSVQVPPTILPLLLLVATEILPSSSFWCHFCGLMLGYGYVAGLFERLQLSLDAVRTVEAWPVVRQTTTWSGFLNSPESKVLPVFTSRVDLERNSSNNGSGGGGGAATSTTVNASLRPEPGPEVEGSGGRASLSRSDSSSSSNRSVVISAEQG